MKEMLAEGAWSFLPDLFDPAAVESESSGGGLTFDPEAEDAAYYNDSGPCLWPIGNLSLCTWAADNATLGPWSHAAFDGEPIPRNYWTLILLAFPVLTVFGNVLVVLSVWRERSLRTVTNYFIVSLAIADIMVAILVMPISVFVEVNNSTWLLGDAFCDTWVAFDVMCCTASILNLTAISVDRFIAVTQPIKYAKHKSSNRVYVMLGLTWVVSLAISSPIALGMNYTERRSQTPTLCIFYNSDFIIYSSMGSFYIPCIAMILLYWRIFRVIRRRARKTTTAQQPDRQRRGGAGASTAAGPRVGTETVTVTAGFQSVPAIRTTTSEGEGTDEGVQTELLPTSRQLRIAFVRNRSPAIAEETSFINHNVRLSTTDDATTPEREDNGGATTTTASARGTVLLRPTAETEENSSAEESTSTPPTELPRRGYNACGYSAPLDVRTRGPGSQDSSPGVSVVDPTTTAGQRSKVKCRETRKVDDSSRDKRPANNKRFVKRFNFHLKKPKRTSSKEKSNNRRERKATKTLAIVLGVFLFCWVPFFTINIINAICIRYNLFGQHLICEIDPILFSFFVWLGYINSFLNPAIYTIFNIEFRRAFKKILTIRRR